jgi:hypothetical protein
MVCSIKDEVRSEAISTLCGAPSFADQPVYIGPLHGASVVEAEERIKLYSLQLSLPARRASFAGKSFV